MSSKNKDITLPRVSKCICVNRSEESGQRGKGSLGEEPLRSAIRLLVPCKSGKGLRPQHFRYIGLHRPNVLKKESLAWFSNQAVLRFVFCQRVLERLGKCLTDGPSSEPFAE